MMNTEWFPLGERTSVSTQLVRLWVVELAQNLAMSLRQLR